MFSCAKCGSEIEADATQCPSCGEAQPKRYVIFKKPDKDYHLFKITDLSDKRVITTYRSDGLTVIRGVNPDDKAWVSKKAMTLFLSYNIVFMDKTILVKQKFRGYDVAFDGIKIIEKKYNWEYVFQDKKGETLLILKRHPVGLIFDIEIKEYDFTLLCIVVIMINCIFNGENYKPLSM